MIPTRVSLARVSPARLSLALPLALLVACSPSDRAGAPAGETGGTLVIATVAEPRFLMPPVIATAVEKQIVDQVFETLANIPSTLSPLGDSGWTPRLAQRWTWSADSMSIAFHLDPAAHFHDGRPVRASDVRFSLAVVKDPATQTYGAERFANLDSVTVADSLTAVVWFARRSPEQFYQVAYNLHVLPEHLLGSVDRARLAESDFARQPVGSGPFRFERWSPRAELELVADTTYHLGRARLDRVLWSVTPDPSAAMAKVLAGEADLMDQLTREAFEQVRGTQGTRLHRYAAFTFGYLAFNFRDPDDPSRPHRLFADPGLRRAITTALDRSAMTRNVFDTIAVVPAGPFPGRWITADASIAGLPYDSAAAGRMLDSLGWRDANGDGVRERNGVPLRFSLLYPSTSRMRERFGVLLQEQLRRAGVGVDLDVADPSTMGPRMFTGKFDAMINALQFDPAPSALAEFWRSAPPAQRGANFSAYANPAVDALMDSASAETDHARYRALHQRAYRIMVDDAAGIWLYDLVPYLAAHPRIRLTTDRDTWWADLRHWWIPSAERIDRDRIGLGPAAQ